VLLANIHTQHLESYGNTKINHDACTAVYYEKCTCQAKGMPNSKKTEPVALIVVKLHLSEGVIQAISQAVSYRKCYKLRFYSLMTAF